MYTIQELAAQFDYSPKTIAYLIRKGRIPRPIGRTRAATYDKRHVAALDAYRAHFPRPGDRFTADCFAERRASGHLETHCPHCHQRMP